MNNTKQKHILYITQYYFTPDDVGDQRSYKHIEYLLKQGYKVSVICTYVNMMSTTIPDKYKQYEGKRIAIEKISDNLTIYFVNSTQSFKKTFWSRAKSYISFSNNVFLAGLKIKNIDLVVASGPPSFACIAGYNLALLNKAKLLYEVRDLWPEALFIGKTNTNPLIHKLLFGIDKFLCQQSNVILALNKLIKEKVLLRGVCDEKVKVITNGADFDIFPRDKAFYTYPKSLIREEDNEYVLVYAGNLGISHGVEALIKAAKIVNTKYPQIKFALVGESYHRQELMKMAKELDIKNLHFYGGQPRAKIPEILYSSNGCLLTTKDDPYMNLVLGNKMLEYLTSGRPIVMCHSECINTEIARECNCGIIGPPDDPETFAKNIIWLYENQEEAKQMGIRGREYIEKHYDRQKILEEYGIIVADLVQS